MNSTEIKAQIFDLDMQANMIAQRKNQLMQQLAQVLQVEQAKRIEDAKKAESKKKGTTPAKTTEPTPQTA